MDTVLLIAIAAIITIILIGITLYKRGQTSSKGENKARPVGNRQREGPAPPRRAQLARNRARLRANVARDEVEDDNIENEPQGDQIEIDGKLGAKKRAKLEAKAEKKAKREAEEQLRADRKKKQELEEEQRKKQEEKRKAEELKQEEEERKAREEKERREQEEYLKMKEAFSVEEEGYEEGEEGNEQNILQEFVKYVKDNKVVVIEDLAAKFKLKTSACIERIKDLQNDNILSGVIDDRGKFIYVSQKELEDVATFIRQRGRVSIAELAENSNKLINLTPSVSA